MSKLNALRRTLHYETDSPRCGTCVHYRKQMVFLRDSLPKKSHATCVKHYFTTKPNAICDTWQGANGDILEANDNERWQKQKFKDKGTENASCKSQPAQKRGSAAKDIGSENAS